MLVTAAGAGVMPARRERRPDEAEAIPEPV